VRIIVDSHHDIICPPTGEVDAQYVVYNLVAPCVSGHRGDEVGEELRGDSLQCVVWMKIRMVN
jgi:hypothetical protein